MSQTKLIEDNMKLVYYIIHTNYPTYRNDEDMEQIGMVGLCKAAQTWDGETSEFSTYACKCIINEIRYELAKRSRQVPQLSLDHKVNGETEDTFADFMGEEFDFELDMQFESFFITLKPREQEIVKLLSTGLCRKEVAEKIGVSNRTVQSEVHKIKSKWRKYNGKNGKNRNQVSW